MRPRREGGREGASVGAAGWPRRAGVMGVLRCVGATPEGDRRLSLTQEDAGAREARRLAKPHGTCRGWRPGLAPARTSLILEPGPLRVNGPLAACALIY